MGAELAAAGWGFGGAHEVIVLSVIHAHLWHLCRRARRSTGARAKRPVDPPGQGKLAADLEDDLGRVVVVAQPRDPVAVRVELTREIARTWSPSRCACHDSSKGSPRWTRSSGRAGSGNTPCANRSTSTGSRRPHRGRDRTRSLRTTAARSCGDSCTSRVPAASRVSRGPAPAAAASGVERSSRGRAAARAAGCGRSIDLTQRGTATRVDRSADRSARRASRTPGRAHPEPDPRRPTGSASGSGRIGRARGAAARRLRHRGGQLGALGGRQGVWSCRQDGAEPSRDTGIPPRRRCRRYACHRGDGEPAGAVIA